MQAYTKEFTEQVGEYILDHFRYEPETGLLFRTKACSTRTDISKSVGSINTQGYLDVDLGKAHNKRVRNTRVHRVSWFLHYGEWPSGQLDHVNGNKQDNRICNLRLVDHRNNQRNGFSKAGTSSVYKGVNFHRGRWRAYIMLPNKKYKHLGQFSDEVLAAKAYDKAAKEFFGDFSRLNFPNDESVSAKLLQL